LPVRVCAVVNAHVGDVILISERSVDRSRSANEATVLFFAPGCPISYLVAERAERALGEVEWIPVSPFAPFGRELFVAAATEAHRLRLPLVVPDNPGADARPLTRAASLAAEDGVCASFGLAAARLVFCGGYGADDPHVTAEAARIAGLRVRDALAAAADPGRDAALTATRELLAGRGLHSTPALRIGGRWFEGFQALPGGAVAGAAREKTGVSAQFEPVF
jgi:2-hydroxychromene-2-carboxylate isomerase